MPIILPISKMSTLDKLRAMEDLWTSLTVGGSSFPLPAWHKSELLETEKRVASAEEEFIDWEEAKKSLRRRAK
jgi:Putative addiction module component